MELDSSNVTNQSELNKTISEMVYVDDSIEDGLHLCNLQLPRIETDAVPSNPELIELSEV